MKKNSEFCKLNYCYFSFKKKDKNKMKTKRKLSDYMFITFRGIAMGAADVVPGVSGGTIAFITGIYEELIDSIKAVNMQSLRTLFKDGIAEAWKSVNGNFLLALFIGIFISVFSLAKGIKYLLDTHPIVVWSFFLGLILSSSLFVARAAGKFKVSTLIIFHAGIAISAYITYITPATANEAYWFIFLSGAIAICAMILPGVSGSFILVLLGMYGFILEAVSTLNIAVIAIFGLGAVAGLLSFSNLLSWLLKNYKSFTIATLAGFMVGSINKIWPWKRVTEWSTDRHGVATPLTTENILPTTYSETAASELASGSNDPQIFLAVVMFLVGIATIVAFEFSFNRKKKIA